MIPRIRARRRGFTLVELMLVVALMAVLVALSTGAYFRIRASELIRATEATLGKLNMGLDKRWASVRAQAIDDLKTNNAASNYVLQYAGGDQDRARVIMTYLKFKNEFPTSFAEAKTAVVLPPLTAGGSNVTIYPARSIFSQLPATGGTPEEQSAACFYLALTATGNRGETFGADGTANQTGDIPLTGGSGTARVFLDSWGQPIMFIRQAYTPELNAAPYVRANTFARDMLDPPVGRQVGANQPMGRLLTFTPPWTPALLQSFWQVGVAPNHISYPNFSTTSYPQDLTPPNLPWNWVPTLISAGPNKTFGGNSAYFEDDNLVSYRLRREGNRGN